MTVSLYCHPKILLPWQRDVTTSPRQNKSNSFQYKLKGGLYLRGLMIGCIFCLQIYGPTAVYGIPPINASILIFNNIGFHSGLKSRGVGKAVTGFNSR